MPINFEFQQCYFASSLIAKPSNDRWKDRIGFTGDIVTIEVKAGELLAFDYRVLHRALSHKGTENRPMLYYTFTKRWFTDAMNFADLPSLNEADTKVEG